MNRRVLAGICLLAAGLGLAELVRQLNLSTHAPPTSDNVTVTIRLADPSAASTKHALAVGDRGYGSVSGRVVLVGEIPLLPDLVGPEDRSGLKPEDALCVADGIPDESLIVDRETLGIANVFVYLAKATNGIHPDLQASPERRVITVMEGCRYKPHALLARTDQQMVVRFLDRVPHNVHVMPLRNWAPGFSNLPDANRENVWQLAKSESRPIFVVCDLHTWMKALWLILDHPYAAITDAGGNFKIAQLPAGNYEFVVWHEKCGYIHRSLKVKVRAGEATVLGALHVTAEKFEVSTKAPR
jgi:hypothetical protein